MVGTAGLERQLAGIATDGFVVLPNLVDARTVELISAFGASRCPRVRRSCSSERCGTEAVPIAAIGYSIHTPFIGYVDGVHPRRGLE